MLVGGALVIGLLATVGSLMTNYALREARLAEVEGALRAAVSAAGALFAGAGGAAQNARIEERVEDFLSATVDGLDLDGVTVSFDSATGITEVDVAGSFGYEGFWGQPGGTIDVERTIRVRFEADRYEVAVALDLSRSMNIPFGSVGTRLDGLKAAMGNVTTAMRQASADDPGSMMVSVVPFASAVNVADTGGSGQTDAKERYVRMLVGPAGTTAQLLARARRQAASGKGGHWVDTFHHYGVGAGMGPLERRFLPEDLRAGRDWNLRREDVEVDVATQVPALGTWTVDDVDFWNGCVMARWGAYWHPDARGAGWRATDAGNWPARSKAPAWSPRGTALPRLPLHLSDDPPAAADPNTLFTAYSWPDARIGGTAAWRLQTVMMEVLDGAGAPYANKGGSDNNWSFVLGPGGAGGDGLCPPSAVTPLTADIEGFRRTVQGLRTVAVGPGTTFGGTYLNLGVVWGLRTLSPLWRPVWSVDDLQGVPRPLVPCAPGETTNCADPLEKVIVLVSDGESAFQAPVHSPPQPVLAGLDVNFLSSYIRCLPGANSDRPKYDAAWTEDTPARFNAGFGGGVDSSGEFTNPGIGAVVDALMTFGDPFPGGASRRANLIARLAGSSPTPWQVFRGVDAGFADFLMDPANRFGFDGRPIPPNRALCAPHSVFGPYGRVDDGVQAGGAPVFGVAPFSNLRAPYQTTAARRLTDWFLEACGIAGRRDVRIEAIFIGNRTSTRDIAGLERCVDAAGGDPGSADVFVTPDANALSRAFAEIFTIRRNLRFLD